MSPLAVSSIVLSWCFSTCEREACGSETGMRPVAMKFAVVSTMVNSTSMISTNGMTLSVSKGRSSIGGLPGDLPFEHQHFDPAQEGIVDDHRYQRHDEPHRGCL